MTRIPDREPARPRSWGRQITVALAGLGVLYAIGMGAFVLLRNPGITPGQQTAVVFAVGNLGGPRSADTTALVSTLSQHRMDALLLLGDLAPPDGSSAAWDQGYQPVFGGLDASVRPTPGDVEYAVSDAAAGYFAYFKKHTSNFANAPYYAFTLGGWRIYSLDSRIGQGMPGSDMYEWLRQDLTTTTAGCIAAFWHDPVRTAGPGVADGGGMGAIQSLLAAEGADIVLSAHDENYQRWKPTDGITSFVVGTGGAGVQATSRNDPALAASAAEAGALELDLHGGAADYQFVTTDGRVRDSGSLRCHGRPSAQLPRPGTPTGLHVVSADHGVKIGWTAVAGGPAPIGYLVYRGADLVGFTPTTTFADTALPAGASVLYTVRSVAASGARSLPSDPVHSGGSAPGYTDYAWALQDQNPASPTADKPQSKLWFNDGTWWGILYGTDPAQPGRSAYFIERLDAAAQSWVNTGVAVDERNRSHADALWDPASGNLYVASTIQSGAAKLYRYSYVDGTYSLDSGFPVRLTEDGSESITVAKDSTGMLWVTMTQLPDGSGPCRPGQGCVVEVMHTKGADWEWTSPYELPGGPSAVNPDDISAVVSYGGRYIGVAWSNQDTGAFLFATHVDGASDRSWKVEAIEVAPRGSDDHLNLKADSAGRVYLIGKTSLNDPANASPKLALMELWVRDPNGSWRSAPVWTVADDVTRPQIVVDEDAGRIYAIAAQPGTGGSIYVKSASISDLVFPSGLGTVLLSTADMNNPTTTKQTVSLQKGILVLAGDTQEHTYWHNFITARLMAGAG